MGGPEEGAAKSVFGAGAEGGKCDGGGLLKAAAADGGGTGGGTEVTSTGAEGTGEGATKGTVAEGLTGGRDGCGVEDACGGRGCPEDTFGEDKELAAARGAGEEDSAAAASPAELGRGVPGGVLSIPLSSIIFLQLDCGPKRVSA